MAEKTAHTVEQPPGRGRRIARAFMLVFAIYVFLLSVNMMGQAFRLLSGSFIDRVLEYAGANPLIGLMAGVMCTAIVQSSGFVTSMVVSMVASGSLAIPQAVPIVMGANIGTTVTNTLVSLGHISRKDDFRRACGGAIVHDLFNILTVVVLFPLEVTTGLVSRGALWIGSALLGSQTPELPNPFEWIVRPVSRGAVWILTEGIGLSTSAAGGVLAGAALLALFAALLTKVRLLRAMMVKRVEALLNQVLFRNAGTAMLVGVMVTFLVQSSSVTTSVMVPLVGAGVLVIEQVYPYTLGANVGTTFVAVMAALATGKKLALVCAGAHLLFNVLGILIFYPLRVVPISLAKGLAAHFAEKRYRAPLHVALLFFVVPGVILLIKHLWG